MKRWVLVICLILLISLAVYFIKDIGKMNTTGKAVEAGLSISISIVGPPTLTLHSPVNGTYLSKDNILLNFTALSADSIWYKVDSGANTTITSSTYFNVSGASSHTLFIYANNSNGTSSKNVTFAVNSTRFVIIDDEFEEEEDEDENMGNMTRHPKKGSSTDFLDYSYEEMQDLDNIILDDVEDGKILFTEAINLTDDSDISDNELNINDNVEVSFNNIEINSAALPNFNKSATLWLYNLTFTNPRILKDGVVCSSGCVIQDYSGGTLIFDVDGFSIYSAEETSSSSTSSTSSTSSSGGGGGISGFLIKTSNFTIGKDIIKVSLKQGETKKEDITIKNTLSKNLAFSISSEKISDFIRISEEDFELVPGEERTITIDFLAREDSIPDLYIGKIIVSSGEIKQEILVSIDIESRKSLFDVALKVPEESKTVLPGHDVHLGVDIYNLGEVGRVDALVEYIIKDKEGNEIAKEQETLAVETKVSLSKNIRIPENAPDGKYIAYVRVTYNGEIASSSDEFSVSKSALLTKNLAIYVLLAALSLTVIWIYFEIKKIKKSVHFKIQESVLIKRGLVKK